MRTQRCRCRRSPACMASGSLPCTAWLSATEPRCGVDRRHLARRRRSRLQAVLAFAQELVRRRSWRNRQRRRRRQRWLALPARVRPRDANAREAAPTAALAHTERGPSGARARLRARGAPLGRFRIRFLAERVVQARDIQDALRQAESFEAIEVTAVTHEE